MIAQRFRRLAPRRPCHRPGAAGGERLGRVGENELLGLGRETILIQIGSDSYRLYIYVYIYINRYLQDMGYKFFGVYIYINIVVNKYIVHILHL